MKQLVRRMWERCTLKQAWTRSISADAEFVRRNGTGCRWPTEMPYKEELELFKAQHCFEGVPLRSSIVCGEVRRLGQTIWTIWETAKLSMLASSQVSECYSEAEEETRADCVSCRTFCGRAHGLLEADHSLHQSKLYCHCFPFEDYGRWVSSRHGKRQCSR